MKMKGKLVLFLALLVLVIFASAPWMDDQAIHNIVFEERARIDGTIEKQTGELLCEYNVMWVPFGRWVASCEGGYFFTFWGQLL